MRSPSPICLSLCAVSVLTLSGVAHAQAPDVGASAPTTPKFTLGGYAEALYSWNFNEPSNGLTNFRGFDNRHNSFTLSNVALHLVARGDAFFEHAASNAAGTASAIFWPARWVSSATATVDYRPHERVSLRLEYRHDHAAGDMYFGSDVMGDGNASGPFVPNRGSQDTFTAGATTWF